MVQRVNPNLQKALTNVEDGIHAVSINDSKANVEHFASEAEAALDSIPQELPYIENYRSALGRNDFESAFEALANLAAYIENDEAESVEFSYQQGVIERIHDSYREFQDK